MFLRLEPPPRRQRSGAERLFPEQSCPAQGPCRNCTPNQIQKQSRMGIGDCRVSIVDFRSPIGTRRSRRGSRRATSHEPRTLWLVIPAKAGIHRGEGILPLFLTAGRACPELVEGMLAGRKAGTASPQSSWIPAFAGMTAGVASSSAAPPLSLPNGLGMVFRREAMPISPAIPRRHRWPDGKAAPLSLPPIGFSMVRLRSPQVYECRVPIPIENRHSTIGNGVHAFLLATKIASRIPGTSLLFCPGSRYPPRRPGLRTSRKRYTPDSRSPSKRRKRSHSR